MALQAIQGPASPGARLVLFSALLLGCAGSAFALPDWMKEAISASQTQEYHADAPASILLQMADARFGSDGCKTRVRQVVRILKPSGYSLSAVSIPVSSDDQVKGLKGWHLSPDGTEAKLKKEEIVSMDPSSSGGYYTDSSILFAQASGVEVGSIVGYEYTIEEKGLPSSFQNFPIQTQAPVDDVRCSIEYPTEWSLRHIVLWDPGLARTEEKGHVSWAGRDLPYRPDEPLSPSWSFLQSRILVTTFDSRQSRETYFPDWNSVSRWTQSIHDGPSSPGEAVEAETRELLDPLRSPFSRARAIADYAAAKVRYVAVEIGEGRWVPRDAERTLSNRYGDCKDKTSLMRAMLTAGGIRSAPVLINARRRVMESVPTPFQFNHVIVGIPRAELGPEAGEIEASADGWVFFDPTVTDVAFGGLPPALQGARVLIGDGCADTLTVLPYVSPERFHHRSVSIIGSVHPDNSARAKVRIIDTGLAAIGVRESRSQQSATRLLDDWRASITGVQPRAQLSAFESYDSQDSTILEFDLLIPDYLLEVGTIRLLDLNPITPARAVSLRSPERTHPISFGGPETQSVFCSWALPEGWTVDEAPLETETGCDAGSIRYALTESENGLVFQSLRRLDGWLLRPEDYEAARAFDKASADLSAATVSLRAQP